MYASLPSADVIDREFANWRNEQARRRPASTDVNPVAGNELATKYMAQNAWMRDPARAHVKDHLLVVDRQLAAEGYDTKSPEHFAEMSRRVHARYPDAGVKMLDGRGLSGGGSRAAQAAPVASARSATSAPSQASAARRNQVSLTPSDLAMARRLGLDSADKKVQARFAREKLARLQMESNA